MDVILVTGGTGTLGRHVVRRLGEAGYTKVRVLTRRTDQHSDGVEFMTGDLLTGAGVAAAVEGVATIVHCAGSARGDEVVAQNLVRAAARAGQPHVVTVSVVGVGRMPVVGPIDRLMFSYFDMKLKTEQAIAGSGLPWTTVRVTQFYELVFLVVSYMAKLPVVPVPSGTCFQPLEADEVAARLVELALEQPMGLVADMGGPRIYAMADLLRSYLDRTHRRRLLLPLWLPGKAAQALRAGADLTPDHAVGIRTWEDYLSNRLAQAEMIH